jgi:hypothetical protein
VQDSELIHLNYQNLFWAVLLHTRIMFLCRCFNFIAIGVFFCLVDARLSYKRLVGQDGDNSVSFRLNVNNVLDEVYVSESRTNNFATGDTPTYDGVATTNQVYF